MVVAAGSSTLASNDFWHSPQFGVLLLVGLVIWAVVSWINDSDSNSASRGAKRPGATPLSRQQEQARVKAREERQRAAEMRRFASDVHALIRKVRAVVLADVLEREAITPEVVKHLPYILGASDLIRPPRHARLREKVDRNVLLVDIADLIVIAGRIDTHLLEHREITVELELWKRQVGKVFSSFEKANPYHDELTLTADFNLLIEPSPMSTAPIATVLSAFAIYRAHMALGVNYLMEMNNRMPGYIESSNPGGSIYINDSNIHGPVAIQLKAINSTIAGILQQGNDDTGAALKALGEAVLVDTVAGSAHQQELLETVDAVAEEVAKQPGERKLGLLNPLLAAVKKASLSGPAIAASLDGWKHVWDSLGLPS